MTAPSGWRAGLIALAALAALTTRTAMPIDETRYLAVAWEMWQRGDFLVPWLNGAPYSHKPPLLFWLIHAGWAVLGVDDRWPRLVAPLCALATLAVTVRIARTLWPDAPERAQRAAWILAGSALFALFATMLMFDMLLTLCVAVGVLGLARAATQRHDGFVWLAIGIGAGVLAKGPAVLLHLAPAALLAPWWADRGSLRWSRWYAGIALALAGGAAIALAWAIPAGMRGGEAYREAIFWGQTAHRLVDSFAHRRPFWWYVPWLVVALAPWVVWRPLWRGVRSGRVLADRGTRLALALMLPALVGFSLTSGKQLHYLLPQFPAFALFAARALEGEQRRSRPWPAAIALAAIGIAALLLPHLTLPPSVAALADTRWWWGLPFFALAVWIALPRDVAAAQVPKLAAASIVTLAALHVAYVRPLASAWDVRPLAGAIARLQAQGTPIAHDGAYHGQYQFAGRLAAPLPELDDVEDARQWLAAHPDGRLIVYFRDAGALRDFDAIATQPFRGRWAAIVPHAQALRAIDASRAP